MTKQSLVEVLDVLFHAGHDRLTSQELRAVAGAAAQMAESLAAAQAEVADSVAAAVIADTGRAGVFRDAESVTSLMVTVGRSFDLVAGLIFLSGAANGVADRRAEHAERGADHE